MRERTPAREHLTLVGLRRFSDAPEFIGLHRAVLKSIREESIKVVQMEDTLAEPR